MLRRQEITTRGKSGSAKSENGHKATCRRLCIHARQRVLYPAAMKGLTRGERQADLHFRKVSDMPCYTGHSNPGIHYSNADHLNGFLEGSNCTCEKCHTAACSYQRVVQASEAGACCGPWGTGPPPHLQLHLQPITSMATRVVTECITQKLLPIPAPTPMASLHQGRVQSADLASRPCLALPFSPALLTMLQP